MLLRQLGSGSGNGVFGQEETSQLILFGHRVSVIYSRYKNNQIRIDLVCDQTKKRPHHMFSAKGIWEVTTSIDIMLPKHPYSWIDPSRTYMNCVVQELQKTGAFCAKKEPTKLIPPFGAIFQRIKCCNI